MAVAELHALLGDVLKREFDRDYCRETVVLEPREGGYPLGSVLGKKETSGQYVMSIAGPVEASEGVLPSDGEDVACAVLIEHVTAEQAEKEVEALAVVRGPVIVGSEGLVFDESVVSDAQKAVKHQQLAARGLVVRQSV